MHRKMRCTSAMHRATTALWEGFVELLFASFIFHCVPHLSTPSNFGPLRLLLLRLHRGRLGPHLCLGSIHFTNHTNH